MRKICKCCGKEFEGKARQTYCSRECEYESMRTSERDHVCVNCGKVFIRPKRNRDSCQFCSRECAFEHNARAARSKRHSKRIRQCKECKKIFFIHGHITKYCSDDCRRVGSKRQIQAYAHDRYVQGFTSKHKVCLNCGKEFWTEYKKSKSFCTNRCKEAYAREVKRLRKHRLDGKIIDSDITLTKLCARDDSICRLCGLPVDWSDYIIDKNGAFIAGKNYPSVDHIHPISRGGLHAWDNVQLAHFGCNSTKSDSIA